LPLIAFLENWCILIATIRDEGENQAQTVPLLCLENIGATKRKTSLGGLVLKIHQVTQPPNTMTLTYDFPEFQPGTRLNAIGFQTQEEATPVSNTGVKWTKDEIKPVFEVGIDWIAGTTNESRSTELMAELGQFFTDEFVDQERGVGFYQESYKSTLGILVGLKPHGTDRDDCYFSIPGSVVGAIAHERIHELVRLLIYKYDFHFSRMDLKLDDYSKTITPELAYAAIRDNENGESVSGFRAYQWIESNHKKGIVGNTLNLGRLGNKGSGKYLVIYNKAIESNGEIDATRMELRLSGDTVKSAATLFAAVPVEDIGKYIFDIITSSVDFINRDESKRLDRAVRLNWWAIIADGREKIKLSGIHIKSTLDGAKRWVHNQVAPILATIVNAFANEQDWNDWFWDVVMNGEKRMQERHHALVNVDKKLKGMVMG
jgi:DNA relaxase NicK